MLHLTLNENDFQMKKKFNITGVCYPHLHYMMDTSQKMEVVMEMVEEGEYFIINRPRQYGKTTTLYLLGEELRKLDSYIPIEMNFQGVDEQWHQSDQTFARMFMHQLQKVLKYQDSDTLLTLLNKLAGEVHDMDTLSEAITSIVHQSATKLVLIIDEVDASSNYQPFLSFLGMLRTKYLARVKPQHATFHSIVLAGVHDIKSLKHKIRDTKDSQYNSPWNIAADFEVDMTFNPQEIAPMLEEYAEAEGVKMNVPAIAERLHYYTSGYPFLVTKLCKNIRDKILKKRKEQTNWTLEDVDASVQLLLKENNTNFDSLIKNLENHQDLYDLVFKIVIDHAIIAFNQYNPTIYKGILYGVFKPNGRIRIHNHVYEQLIYDYMASKVEVQMNTGNYHFENQFVQPSMKLDMEKILIKFQQFIKEQYSDKDRDFLEREWRLVFLAFVKPIINGEGYDFKEPQISQEKRLDIIVTFHQHRYIIELKRWYGSKAHEQGLDQLTDYLDIHGLAKGYLVIFDNRKEKSWESKHITHKGKSIFAVWV